MAYYFSIQFKRVNRQLEALGFNVVLAYILVGLIFFGASQLLFEKIKYAQYLYIGFTLWACYKLGEPNRNRYLQLLFHQKNYRLVRLIENTIIALPFILFLFYQSFYLEALIVLILTLVFSLMLSTVSKQFTIPTPFYKKPFEFVVGFRKNYILFILYYVLAGIGIYVDNFNLSVFALMLSLITCLNFYTKPEPKFYTWIYAFQPVDFLKQKIQTALLQSWLLVLPLATGLLIFYPSYWYITSLMVFLITLNLILMLLGKYAYYPAEVNLIQVLAVAFSIFFPPLLCISLPYFYIKAKQNLSLTVL